MGRKSAYSIGQMFGGLEVLEIIPSEQSGRHVNLRCKCHYCGNETIKNGVHTKKIKSCGCQQHNSKTWKRVGAKFMPWQLPSGEAAKKNLLREYKRSAETRNLSFELTEEEFYSMVIMECVYCGDKLTGKKKGLGKTSGDFIYTGLDRIDSTKGYEINNVVPCCWKCNNMKSTLSTADFFSHIKKIYQYMENQNV